MSIANLIHKIKGKAPIDRFIIMYLCVVALVGVSSFGLGRLSLFNNDINEDKKQEANLQTSKLNIYSLNTDNMLEVVSTNTSSEKRYVASKNGKLYYSLGCSGAKRIKSENQIFFRNIEEAEKSGFTLATSCK